MKQLFLLFVIVSLNVILRAELNEFVIKEIDAPKAAVVIQRNFPNSACLTVYSSIAGLKFESGLDGIEGINEKPESGKYYIYLKPHYKDVLTVKAPGYREGKIQISTTLQAKETIYYSIEPQIVSGNTGKGSFTIDTIPTGAVIRIDGLPTFREITPFTLDDFAAFKYRIMITKRWYEDVDTTITVEADKHMSVVYKMIPLVKGEIIVISNLPDTKFTVVDLNSNNTWVDEQIRKTVFMPGKYKIIADASKYGYLLKEQIIDIMKDNNVFTFYFGDEDKKAYLEHLRLKRLEFAKQVYPDTLFSYTPFVYSMTYRDAKFIQFSGFLEYSSINLSMSENLLNKAIWGYGASVFGYGAVSSKYLYFDALSFSYIATFQTNNLKNRCILDASIGLKDFVDYTITDYSYHGRKVIRGKLTDKWDDSYSRYYPVVGDFSLTVERYLFAGCLLSLRGGALLTKDRKKWYYKSDLDEWAADPTQPKPVAIDQNIGFLGENNFLKAGDVKYGFCPFFGFGLKF